MNISHRIARALAVSVFFFTACFGSAAYAALLSSCGFSAGTSVAGDNISRGFYVTNYAGQSLRTVRLRHYASVPGVYAITLTARAGTFDGPVIGAPYTATATLNSSSTAGVDVLYEMGDMPVTPGSIVTFAMSATGPGNVLYDVAVPLPCANVAETEGVNAPLSAFRRDRVGYEIYGRAITQTFYDCGFVPGGDLYSRGVYINAYPGETLRKVSFRYETVTSGARTLRLTARHGGYNGSVIGVPQTKTINFLGGSSNGQTIEWDFGGAFVEKGGVVAFTHEVTAGDSGVYRATATSNCAGVVATEGTSAALDTARNTSGIRVTGDAEAGFRRVVEYYVPSLQHFFISGRPHEQALLDQFPAVYQRTGATFLAFPSVEPPQGSVSICRFYLPPSLGGPNSHFYGQPADCNAITALNNPMFQFEGYDFALYAPVGGACPGFAPKKVYRSFNNRVAQNDGNHRYTTTLANYNAMTAQGWVAEGAVFCSDSSTP